MSSVGWPRLGAGVGLRLEHYDAVLAGLAGPASGIDWFEVITENFLGRGGNPRRVLETIRASWPVVLHGVSLGIGNTAPLDLAYLRSVAELALRIEPAWVSDHLCFGGNGGHYAHDLWPLPYTEEALDHVVERVYRVQEILGRRILLENPSIYVSFRASCIPEPEFLAAVCARSDCGLLLDVNNICVSGFNLGFDPIAYLDAIPVDLVGQYHLAGHTDHGTHRLDTHDHPVPDEVWALFQRAIARFGPAAALVEWDDHIPELEVLVAEAAHARGLMSASATRP